MSITKLILTSGTTVHDIIQCLDTSGVGILPIVDPDDHLIGIVTDGDIRRGILQNKLDVNHVINKNPKTLSKRTPKFEILKTLRQMHLRHMPIVDDERRLVDVIFLENLVVSPKSNKVIIMAGGLGTRLGELTRDTPKPMLHVNGKPILHRIVESFEAAGFHNFIFCLNYKSEIIQHYFGNGDTLGVDIDYTFEDKRLGTAGALSLINKSKLTEDFIVANGDVITSLSFDHLLDTHIKHHGIATMCIKEYSIQLPYANIISDDDGNLKNLEEKPLVPFYINAGIYALNPTVLEYIPYNTHFDMTSLFFELKKEGRVIRTFRIDDYWIDIGLPSDFRSANEVLQ